MFYRVPNVRLFRFNFFHDANRCTVTKLWFVLKWARLDQVLRVHLRLVERRHPVIIHQLLPVAAHEAAHVRYESGHQQHVAG